jgi:hypothetical protein
MHHVLVRMIQLIMFALVVRWIAIILVPVFSTPRVKMMPSNGFRKITHLKRKMRSSVCVFVRIVCVSVYWYDSDHKSLLS